ncbi:translation machinery-associated protein 22 [Xylogone sp. PMI_703]|nr:translation machinery-associated protein 22 [Xylogone sp. PMI_703]
MADVASSEAPTGPTEPQSRHVVYCGVCSLPPEYCEFGGTVKKCQDWLQKNHPEMYERIWSDDAIAAAASTLSLDAQKRAAKDAQKKAQKAEAQEQKHLATIAASKVYIKRVERNKRKYVTAVSGLEAFGLDLKKVAKDFGKKFATGSSVTKTASGGEEIVVQGDVSDEIEEFLLDKYKEIPEDNIELIEDKKKGSGAGG